MISVGFIVSFFSALVVVRWLLHYVSKHDFSPFGWYRKIRLRTACELLETTELPIETVAERSGYKSPISFRQQFKQQFNSTPSEWRKAKRRQLPVSDLQ